MKLNIIHRTSEHRGDHDTDLWLAIDPMPGETVEQLVLRVGKHLYRPVNDASVIEIRIIREEP